MLYSPSKNLNQHEIEQILVNLQLPTLSQD